MIPIGITSYLFQLNSAFELISLLNSLLTSTFDGESKYTLCSTSWSCAPNTQHAPLIKSTNLWAIFVSKLFVLITTILMLITIFSVLKCY